MAGYKIEPAWDLQCKSSNYRIWASRVTRLYSSLQTSPKKKKKQQKTRGGREHRQTEEWIMRSKASEHERERERVLSQKKIEREKIVGRMSVRAPGEFESLRLRKSVDFGGTNCARVLFWRQNWTQRKPTAQAGGRAIDAQSSSRESNEPSTREGARRARNQEWWTEDESVESEVRFFVGYNAKVSFTTWALLKKKNWTNLFSQSNFKIIFLFFWQSLPIFLNSKKLK